MFALEMFATNRLSHHLRQSCNVGQMGIKNSTVDQIECQAKGEQMGKFQSGVNFRVGCILF